ncbi:MAG: hypothetical protein MUF22_05235 [Chitinispirillaceae bacterium]|jgi:hypothetical protein|nr:hypothetical protein [Chitinispirillaceae bacterium]
MTHDFYSNWDCWFAGNFQPGFAKKSVALVKSVFSSRALNALRKMPKTLLIGPGADIFGTNGTISFPENAGGCHILVLLDTCGPKLFDQAVAYGKKNKRPVMQCAKIHDIVTCYFIPSAWEKLRQSQQQ